MKIAKVLCLVIAGFCRSRFLQKSQYVSPGFVRFAYSVVDRTEKRRSFRSRIIRFAPFRSIGDYPESMFDYVRCLKLLNGKFYLLDRMGTKLLCFDRDGKFLKKFEARGNGPDEYFMLCFLAAGPVSKKILVADDVVRKIFIFDELLNLEHVVKVDFAPKQVIAFRDDMILRYENDNKEQYQDSLLRDYDLHWIELKGDVVQG